MTKLCNQHKVYTTGCVTCQEDMANHIEFLTKLMDDLVDMVQCTCHPAFKDRKLIDPSCAYHDIDDIIEAYKKSKE